MSVIFRADASSEIGAGHVMRCLALAECVSLTGRKCYFLGHSGHYGVGVVKKIVDAGHEIISLPDLYSATQDENADACIRALSGIDDVEYLIVDHYSLDYRWQGRMRACANKIMVIDDLANRRHDCDVLLDQSFLPGAEGRYDDLLPEGCVKLLGPQFALLRREFWSSERTANRCRQYTGSAPALLIMFGGADAHNLTAKVVDVLNSMKWQGAVDVVVGPLYACSEALKSEIQRLPNARLHVSPNNIAYLMSSVDLAVGSPGGSSWERCACALPSIVISQADNQEAIAVSLGEAGVHLYLGRSKDVKCVAIASAIDVLMNNKIARDFMASNAERLCDGNGASRVVRRLFPPLLSVGKAHLDDLLAALKFSPKLVFCEKPVAQRLAQTELLVERCRHQGVMLAVNYTRRWDPTLIRIMTEIRLSEWGKLRCINGVYNKGILSNGSHMVDLLHAEMLSLRDMVN